MVASPAGNTAVLNTFTFTQSQVEGLLGGDAFRIRLTRNGANVSDTLGHESQLLRLVLRESSAISPLFAIDFTQQPNQDLLASGDGVYAINGFNWQVFGAANLNGLNIVNGTGLVVEFSGNGFGGGTTGLALVAGQLPRYLPGGPIWVLADVDFSGLLSDFTEVSVGMLEPDTPSRHLTAGRKFNSFVGVGQTMIIRWNGQIDGGGSNTVEQAFDDILAAFVDGRFLIEGWHGSPVGGRFPPLDTLLFRRGSNDASDGPATYGGPGFPVYSFSRATPALMFATDGSNSNGETATIRKMRVIQ